MFDSLINYLAIHTPLLYLTQSLWRDEAFSVLVAEPGGLETIRITASDYNPPLYYLILNFWMNLFGKSEIAIRSLSLIFFILLLIYFYKFAKKIFKGKWVFLATFLAFFNPMLVYYGFEARMYSLYAFTTTASMYYFYLKKWKPYILFTTLALYTHPFTVFVPITQIVYLLIKKQSQRKVVKTLVKPFIFYLPWIFVIIQQFKRSKEMWIYPVNFNLIQSVLGNLFTGYEGTPWFLWKYMKIFSLFAIILFIFAFLKKEERRQNLLFFLWVFLPLTLVLGISFFKPLFVNRYLITVSVAEIFLLMIAILSLPWEKLKNLIVGTLLGLSIFYLFFIPNYIKKVDIRKTFMEINHHARKDDQVFAGSPLVFFESLYYFQDRSRVYLYNPDHVHLPNYLGTNLIPVEKQVDTFPKFPKRAFIVYENGSFEMFSSLK